LSLQADSGEERQRCALSHRVRRTTDWLELARLHHQSDREQGMRAPGPFPPSRLSRQPPARLARAPSPVRLADVEPSATHRRSPRAAAATAPMVEL
jgi:hypothetical protein